LPVIKIYPSGSSVGAGTAPPWAGYVPPKRGTVAGWSPGSSRRLVRFLWSVNPDALPPVGYAQTLTCGVTPDSAAEWASARHTYAQRLRRLGVDFSTWVTEWTAKGRPHLHLATFGQVSDRELLMAWLDVAESHGWQPLARAQHITPVVDSTGWLQYVAKHSARGVGNYQRQGAPAGWEKTGRLWGKWGKWPEVEPVEYDVSDAVFLSYRDQLVSYGCDRLEAAGAPAELIASVRARFDDPVMGRFLGASGWIPDTEAARLLSTAVASAES